MLSVVEVFLLWWCGLVWWGFCGLVVCLFYFSFSSFKTLWPCGNYINILSNNSEKPCEAVSNFLDKFGG